MSSTSVVKEMFGTRAVMACGVKMYMALTVGIVQDNMIVICHMIQNGVMADSGANTYMTDSATHLVGRHEIRPVSIGLILATSALTAIHQCTHMG